ncbi:MAG TPA: GNAT family N-acetyltransferase [Candidatus Thermoplasmatota archaeon]|nr:GNAT family N-acetyltransferase [Candidatus Thermoplasmatota archaeon]
MTALPPEPRAIGLRIRRMRPSDVPAVHALARACFAHLPSSRDMTEAHVQRFPEGQLVAEQDGRIVGSASSLLLPYARVLRPHTWWRITGGGHITTHDPLGDVLYGTEMMVDPKARGQGIARRLYDARKELLMSRGLRAFAAGGCIPGYADHADRFTAEEYVAQVVAGRLTDPTLTPQLRAGLQVAGVLEDYLWDPGSLDYATLLLWRNPFWPGTPVSPVAADAARLA